MFLRRISVFSVGFWSLFREWRVFLPLLNLYILKMLDNSDAVLYNICVRNGTFFMEKQSNLSWDIERGVYA